jgi:hypothetical protein
MRFEFKIILVLFIVPLNLTAQKINGKWLNIRQPDELVFPLVDILVMLTPRTGHTDPSRILVKKIRQ